MQELDSLLDLYSIQIGGSISVELQVTAAYRGCH